ncbi:MAG TPA: sulfotransferase family 2 domain-containing protein [Lacipirellulaceae bacterium]|nr:sulfotransferase family 2 domain-containing protein [Lacipirellulaceae bacterium]
MLAVIHIEKCGGTTLIDVLRRNFQLDHFDVIPRDRQAMVFTAGDLHDLLKFRPTVKSIAGHTIRLDSGLENVAPQIRYITCLRDPVRRYVSDYCHFVERLGLEADFEQWLGREDRHNFQTRAIAGEADLDAAIHLLETRFELVGALESFAEFVHQIGLVVQRSLFSTFDPWYEVRNSRWGRPSVLSTSELIGKFGERIAAVNALDTKLHHHVLKVIVPRQRAVWVADNSAASLAAPYRGPLERLRDGRRRLLCRLYRNLVYKPHMRRWPVPHRLPIYEKRRRAA